MSHRVTQWASPFLSHRYVKKFSNTLLPSNTVRRHSCPLPLAVFLRSWHRSFSEGSWVLSSSVTPQSALETSNTDVSGGQWLWIALTKLRPRKVAGVNWELTGSAWLSLPKNVFSSCSHWLCHSIPLIPVACWVEWAETELGRWRYGGRRKAGMGIGSGALEAEAGWTSGSFRENPSQRERKRRWRWVYTATRYSATQNILGSLEQLSREAHGKGLFILLLIKDQLWWLRHRKESYSD